MPIIVKGNLTNTPRVEKVNTPAQSNLNSFKAIRESIFNKQERIKAVKESAPKVEEDLPFDMTISDQVRKNKKSSFLNDMFTIDE